VAGPARAPVAGHWRRQLGCGRARRARLRDRNEDEELRRSPSHAGARAGRVAVPSPAKVVPARRAASPVCRSRSWHSAMGAGGARRVDRSAGVDPPKCRGWPRTALRRRIALRPRKSVPVVRRSSRSRPRVDYRFSGSASTQAASAPCAFVARRRSLVRQATWSCLCVTAGFRSTVPSDGGQGLVGAFARLASPIDSSGVLGLVGRERYRMFGCSGIDRGAGPRGSPPGPRA
jgi:hypothetical protein